MALAAASRETLPCGRHYNVSLCVRIHHVRAYSDNLERPASQHVGRVAVATVRNMITRSSVKGLTMLPIPLPWITQSGMLI